MKDLELGIVQKTLLFPLGSRAYDAESKYPILGDQKALELFKQLVPDRKIFRKYLSTIGIVSLTERGLIMDNTVREFIKKYPKGKVLNLGVGLETSYYRLGEPNVQWYDLDLPDSIALRRKLLPNDAKNITWISKSMFDESWLEDVGDISNGLMITVPGVFPYFDEKMVKQFFNTFAPKLKGAEIIFDVISNMGRIGVQQKIRQSGMPQATLDWGIIDPKRIEKWNPHIKFLQSHYYLQHPSFKNANLMYRFFSFQNKFFKISQIFHFKFI